MIKTFICRYGSLEHNLNEIHSENIISILQGVDNGGILIYTIIYNEPSHIISLKGEVH